MRAAVRKRFGPPNVVEVRDIERPEPGDDEVLVRVRAASLNLGDWYAVVGRPYIGRMDMGVRAPKEERLGTDYAGVVEAVGKDVTGFAAGDEVFGGRTGAWAEYIVAKADRAIVPKPANVSFEEAAAVPVAALTALQALRDRAHVQPGQKVLVNGASGGVGTFAVLVAKALGADVTAVCSTKNVEQARRLGADHVVDYTQDDFSREGRRYDAVIDVAGNRSWKTYKRVLQPKGTLVCVGGPRKNRVMGPLGGVIRKWVAGKLSGPTVTFFVAKFNKPDMEVLAELLAAGKLTPVVDRQFELAEIGDALRYMGEAHPRGKIVITVRGGGSL
jgi:NADPH:quinone reductase-like Zn-dependent oxidoreductase